MEKSPSYFHQNLEFSVSNSASHTVWNGMRDEARNKVFLKFYGGIAIFDFILACAIASSELAFIAVPDFYIAVYNVYNINHDYITTEFPHQSWLFVTVLILAVFWLILEGWLYEVLHKGSLDLDVKKLHQWVNVRVVFLVLNIIQTLYRIFERQFSLYDVVYVPILIYRILEIIAVKGLTVEIRNAQIELNV